MSYTSSAQQELERRIHQLENLIADKGFGSKHLKKARRTQRNANLVLLAGGIAAVAGLIIAISRRD